MKVEDPNCSDVSFVDAVRDVIAIVEKRYANGGVPRRTGYAELDELLGGLQSGTLTLITGPNNVGKTTLACCIAPYVAEHQVAVDLVTDRVRTTTYRLLSAQSGVQAVLLRDGRLAQRDWRALAHAVARSASLPLRLFDLASIEEVIDRIRADGHTPDGDRVIIVDSLDRYLDGDRSLVDIVAALRSAADCAEVAVIATTTVALSLDAPDHEELAVARAADAIVELHRHKAETSLTPMDATVIINHHGPTGTARLLFDRRIPRIANAAPDSRQWTGDENEELNADIRQ